MDTPSGDIRGVLLALDAHRTIVMDRGTTNVPDVLAPGFLRFIEWFVTALGSYSFYIVSYAESLRVARRHFRALDDSKLNEVFSLEIWQVRG